MKSETPHCRTCSSNGSTNPSDSMVARKRGESTNSRNTGSCSCSAELEGGTGNMSTNVSTRRMSTGDTSESEQSHTVTNLVDGLFLGLPQGALGCPRILLEEETWTSVGESRIHTNVMYVLMNKQNADATSRTNLVAAFEKVIVCRALLLVGGEYRLDAAVRGRVKALDQLQRARQHGRRLRWARKLLEHQVAVRVPEFELRGREAGDGRRRRRDDIGARHSERGRDSRDGVYRARRELGWAGESGAPTEFVANEQARDKRGVRRFDSRSRAGACAEAESLLRSFATFRPSPGPRVDDSVAMRQTFNPAMCVHHTRHAPRPTIASCFTCLSIVCVPICVNLNLSLLFLPRSRSAHVCRDCAMIAEWLAHSSQCAFSCASPPWRSPPRTARKARVR